MPKITERAPFGIFQHPFCRKTSKKLKGDPLGKKFPKKERKKRKKKSLFDWDHYTEKPNT